MTRSKSLLYVCKLTSNLLRYKNFLEIKQNMGCSSYVGRHFKHQMLSLANRCEGSYIPLHEAMHALGWLHEQQRPDRDQYVKVSLSNYAS